ncbi:MULTISPECIES: hypothetical protein [Ruminococcus]|uniref:Uncharacterized protein n=1 Tax=Ruminococcus albus (strain ATCC 27210 / DSM 20455 / JCM 14654 / NCDO 2250 / 7) TaxID=697329 RepID=E6UIL3_RUMA7|nr:MULTISPECIES: hypothetical protein [Ruminococcus]ADU23358.1 hypothetical protein Rumal_2892 [Ruminococcus albus 7 = DSM 20455]MCR5019574.1 hypothetical protein [Ruminococcus sp.]
MGIFKKKVTKKVPEDCEGLEIKVQTSTCTGEKTIGFFDRKTGELRYKELVRTSEDIDSFYESYGLVPPVDKNGENAHNR